MPSVKTRRLLGILILLLSLAILAWGLWPLGEVVRQVPISPIDMQLPTPVGWMLAKTVFLV